ncbi:restriction endonuclease [Duganella sp. LX20W]|uniref:Restriction endonuclease n=1 Tax=Rugamonas brunnea TaxID=2758569 RepID=A0A7W2EX53_9BURK|nr:restriction endonuclease [Rugamonas brunnea]MBA5640254.1 restriction endonuclease [Rugamonas brunnea]
MAIPDFQTLMLPVLRISAATKDEVKISDVVTQLAHEFALTPEELSQLLPSGKQTTFANRIHWAKSYLGKAGLIELTRRAHFRVTERGLGVVESPPERIDIKYLNQFPGFQKFREGVSEGGEAENGSALGKAGASGPGADIDAEADMLGSTEIATILTPDEVMRSAHHQLEVALADEMLQRIRSGTPAFFERLVVNLLVAMGYGGGSAYDVEKALVGGPGDGGIDGVIDQDPLGLDRIYVQAKRYASTNTVGAADIRDFFGSLDRFKASKGLFVSASTFTASARQTAEQLSKRIVLIDGTHLTRLMIQHRVGCQIEETLHVKKIDEEFFE